MQIPLLNHCIHPEEFEWSGRHEECIFLSVEPFYTIAPKSVNFRFICEGNTSPILKYLYVPFAKFKRSQICFWVNLSLRIFFISLSCSSRSLMSEWSESYLSQSCWDRRSLPSRDFFWVETGCNMKLVLSWGGVLVHATPSQICKALYTFYHQNDLSNLATLLTRID